MKIWKWQLGMAGLQTVPIPVGAKLLDVQIQHEACCLWALCNESAPTELRTIAIYGTGHPMPEDPGEYVATFQVAGGDLVFHVFAQRRPGSAT